MMVQDGVAVNADPARALALTAGVPDGAPVTALPRGPRGADASTLSAMARILASELSRSARPLRGNRSAMTAV